MFSVEGAWTNVPKETRVVSVMTSKPPGNSGEGQRRKGRSSSPAYHSKAKQTIGEGQNWHPPVCQKYKSEKRMFFWQQNVISDTLRQKESPTKEQTHLMPKGQLVQESTPLGCVSQDSYQRKSILCEPGRL